MGLKLRGPLRCGTCGKPRGITHTCITSATSRRRRRTRAHSPVVWECASCGKPRGLRHTCHIKTDFKKRKRQQETTERQRKRRDVRRRQAERRKLKRQETRRRQAERRKRAAAERRARERERRKAARKTARPVRPRGESHEPGSCGNRDCEKYRCTVYFRGMDACPLPHAEG